MTTRTARVIAALYLLSFVAAVTWPGMTLFNRVEPKVLGLPFNIACYALLTQMVAQVAHRGLGELVISLGDTHLYTNHLEQTRLQLSREPRELPRMWLDPSVKSIFDFRYEHFRVDGYDPHPRIPAPVSV